MNLERDSVLRPLRAASDALAALRAGGDDESARTDALTRVVDAVETTLRRLLRDDATAPLELRLRALSPDDLPADALLAELRQRDRLSFDVAARFHQLRQAAARVRGGGGATPEDAALAVGVADTIERHVTTLPFPPPLEDPAVDGAETMLPADPGEELGHEVPVARRAAAPGWLPWALGGLALLIVAVVLVWALPGRRGGGDLASAEALLRAGRTEQARAEFRRLSEADPNAPMPRFYLARIERRAGRLNEAAKELRTALAANPREPRLYTELGFLLLDSRRPTQAVTPFRTALTYDPNSAAAWGGLVRALREGGNAAQADRALALAPPAVRAALERGGLR